MYTIIGIILWTEVCQPVGQTTSKAQGSHGTGAESGPMSSEGAVIEIEHMIANTFTSLTIYMIRNASDT